MAVLYLHTKPCGEVFYVGIGKEEKRAYSVQNRNKHWRNIVAKYGYEVKVIRDDLTWEYAKELEIFTIDFYGRKDLGKGSLCNLTDGGDGNVGLIRTQESIDKWKKSKRPLIGKLNPMYGKKFSEEHKKKLRESRSRQIFSPETRQKLKESNRSAETVGRKVICVDTLKIWNTIISCQRETKIKSLGSFINPLNNIKNSTTIQYLEDYEKGIITCKQKVKQHKQKVLNVTTGEVYKSMTEASSKNIGANRDTLAKHFKRGDEFTTRFGYKLKLVYN